MRTVRLRPSGEGIRRSHRIRGNRDVHLRADFPRFETFQLAQGVEAPGHTAAWGSSKRDFTWINI